jgi:hypothetical protein
MRDNLSDLQALGAFLPQSIWSTNLLNSVEDMYVSRQESRIAIDESQDEAHEPGTDLSNYSTRSLVNLLTGGLKMSLWDSWKGKYLQLHLPKPECKSHRAESADGLF